MTHELNPNSCPIMVSWSCSCVTQQASREVGSKPSLWLTSRERTLASHHDYPKHVSYCFNINDLTLVPPCHNPYCHTIFWSWIRHGKIILVIQTITFSIPWISPITLCGHTFLGQTHRGAQSNISQLNEGQNSLLINHIPPHGKQLNPYLACMGTLLWATLH